VAFLDPEPDIDQRVAKLLALVNAGPAKGSAGREGADA
jgi:hypothetical protein